MRWITRAALLVALACPASAGAATVELAYDPPVPGIEPDAAYTLLVAGGAGEANEIVVSGDRDAYYVTDSLPLTAGEGCAAVTANWVRCDTPFEAPERSVFVNAGGAADTVEALQFSPRARVELLGGSGDDRLVGGPGGEALSGGAGADDLSGGEGDDSLDGGPGDDVLDGGPGTDRASYARRRKPVEVDLALGTGTVGGENDSLHGIEDAVGGSADDILRGDNGPNALTAGPSDERARDRLVGRGGDDALTGYRVSGGAGDDGLDGRRVSCGAGTDTIRRARFRTRGPFARDCERAIAYFFLITGLHAVDTSKRAARLAFWCVPPRCKFRLELRDRRGPLGTKTFEGPTHAEGGEPIQVVARVPLTRRPARRVVTLRVIAERPFRDRFRIRL